MIEVCGWYRLNIYFWNKKSVIFLNDRVLNSEMVLCYVNSDYNFIWYLLGKCFRCVLMILMLFVLVLSEKKIKLCVCN